MLSCLTNEEMFVCLKYVLVAVSVSPAVTMHSTHEHALANSALGLITKLSFVLDQLIRCDILESSSMLALQSAFALTAVSALGMRHTCTACGRIHSDRVSMAAAVVDSR